MGIAVILVIGPGPFEQIFVPLSDGRSIRNLASIGLVEFEEKMFENVDNIHTHIHTHIRTKDAYSISSPVSLRLR